MVNFHLNCKRQILNRTLSGIWFWYFSTMISLPFQSWYFSCCLFFFGACDRSNVLALDWACFTLQCSVLLAQGAVTIRAGDALNTQGAAESPQWVPQYPSGVSPVLYFGQCGLKWLFLCIRREESWDCGKSRAAVPSPGQLAVFPSLAGGGGGQGAPGWARDGPCARCHPPPSICLTCLGWSSCRPFFSPQSH